MLKKLNIRCFNVGNRLSLKRYKYMRFNMPVSQENKLEEHRDKALTRIKKLNKI